MIAYGNVYIVKNSEHAHFFKVCELSHILFSKYRNGSAKALCVALKLFVLEQAVEGSSRSDMVFRYHRSRVDIQIRQI